MATDTLMTRPQALAYLAEHGLAHGKARFSAAQLREAVEQHRRQTEAHPAPSGHAVVDGPPASSRRGPSLPAKATAADLLAVEAEPTTVAASTDRVERNRLAKAEWAAVKAWHQAGGTPPRPATPNLDAVEAEAKHPAGAKPRPQAASGSRARRTGRPAIRFLHDGKRINDHDNRLASLARFYTKGVDGCEDRIKSARLREILAEASIADPDGTEWEHTLSNGRVLAAVLES